MQRILQPELLDTLDAASPLAQRMRRDLRRINAFMRSASLLAGALRAYAPTSGPRQLLELGGGDGLLLLRVARRLAGTWPALDVRLLDRHPAVSLDTLAALHQLGWRTKVQPAEIFDAAGRAALPAADVVMTNLLLHHFTAAQLRQLLAVIAAQARVFIALEPRRSRMALWGARLTGLIGCHSATRRDAEVSVRAGFAGKELSALWPFLRDSHSQSQLTSAATETTTVEMPHGRWRLTERSVGWFSHLFVAQRCD